jgi:clan AA aspartic protease (TIGR02281 family)
MQRFWSVTVGYVVVALCCVSQPASGSKAENRVFSEGVVAGDDSAAVASPIMEGIRLAQAVKRGEVREENWKWWRTEERVISGGDEETKVKIIGNSVLVPVTLVYGGNEVDVHLLLDTGATRTAIYTEIADQLSINLSKGKKAKAQVAGGAVIEAHVVRINSLTVGPHTIRSWDIFVVPHQGSAARRNDGLLGMDVLRGLKYKVDFKKQVIIWE